MSRDTNRPDKLAKQMFFVGLLGLPWLWIVNILYFFDRVYGRVSCCGTGNTNATEEDRYRNGDENNTTILGLISNAEEEEEEEGNDGESLCTVINSFQSILLTFFKSCFVIGSCSFVNKK